MLAAPGCPIPRQQPVATNLNQDNNSDAAELIIIHANSATSDETGNAMLEGDVSIRQTDQHLAAEQILFEMDERIARATGGVEFQTTAAELTAKRADINFSQRSGSFEQADFILGEAGNARGEAEKVSIGEQQDTIAENMSYTTCPPDKTDWQLRAKSIRINHEKQQGVARDVTLRFQNVPILYLPWFQFPAGDRRQSGLLIPEFGSSGNSGVMFAQPVYWNIAPNLDATFTPRLLSKRGVQAETEFRYLFGDTTSGRTVTAYGEINAAYLPNDSEADRDRYFINAVHSQGARHWRLDWDWNELSDTLYLNDLGDNLQTSNLPYLSSQAAIRAGGDWFTVSSRIARYDALDDNASTTGDPFRVLPAADAVIRWPTKIKQTGLQPTAKISFSGQQFIKPNNIGTGTANESDTLRLYAAPELGLHWQNHGAEAGLHGKLSYTWYSQSQSLNQGTASRTLPVVQAYSRLHFERRASASRIQTLSPEIHALYVPFRDQTDLPLFDSAVNDFQFAWLDHDNRYTGIDRWGDAKRIAVSLSSRWLNSEDGREVFRIRAGQLFYLSDPRLQLANEPARSGRSAWLGEVQWNLGSSFRLAADTRWDSDAGKMERSSASLVYQHNTHGTAAVRWRKRLNVLEQIQLDASRPLGNRWHVATRWHYSLERERTLETLAAVEYRSCCWAFRAGSRRYLRDNNDFDTAIFLQLELSGLGQFGDAQSALFARERNLGWTY